jgi:hypothetical protein
VGEIALDRLLARDQLDALLDAARAAAPDLTIRLVTADGPPGAHGDIRRPLVADGHVLGALEIAGGSVGDVARASAFAELIGRSIELAAVEGLARRAVAGAALDDLRELALLDRLAAAVVDRKRAV